jgi:hypothetical protein
VVDVKAIAEENNGLEKLFARYRVGWMTRNPDLIASLHSDDTVFWVHDGAEPVNGREALRQYCIGLFARYQFGFEEGRTLFGADHWIFEWSMIMDLVDPNGIPFPARIEMLDVVTVNKRGEVTRKDVYLNGSQKDAAYSRAGLDAERTRQG